MVILTIAFSVCLGVAFWLDSATQFSLTARSFYLSIGISLSAALLFFWVGRGSTKKFFRKEALCTIGLAWLLASFVGSIPFAMVLPDASLADAIFESASGLTTTGASVFGNLESFPPSLMFWRCLSQWIGGM